MATILASQLAQIRTQSINSFDLKAQKKAHSQSLLFEQDVAGTQDFDTIYQICYEAFEELCRLDVRFVHFAGNIFSDQSKQEDRTQMTATQNQQLDVVLEDFMHLVSGKLLLKPAQKAVEWLVRRFRVHESNTTCLVLSFLPFHETPVFATVLSILPQSLPPTLKFLHPYIRSLANPPRHAIVYTASNNRQFFSVLNAHVLKSSRLGHQHPALISFWASTATEAAASMLDQARSAKLEAQQQNHEDVTLFLLPILNEGLSLERVPDIRVGCYMVLTVLASKAALDDAIIAALMEAVTSDWTQTSHAGLICLSVLAQQSQTAKLPKKVFKAVIALKKLEDDLMTLQEQYRVERLTLGVILGIINGLKKSRDARRLRLLRFLMEAGFMDEASTTAAIESILSGAQHSTPETNPKFDAQGHLSDLILRLADSKSIGRLVQNVANRSELATGTLGTRLQGALKSNVAASDLLEDVDMEDANERMPTEGFETLTRQIPTRTAYEISFLSFSDSHVFSSLAHVFVTVSTSSADLQRFSNLPVLRKSLAMSDPLFVSFFIRIWCGNSPATARSAAIQLVSKYLAARPLSADVQVLLPYLISALADHSPKVRRAATELALTLGRAYATANENDGKNVKLPILGHEQIYGQGKETKELIAWLSMSETYQFLSDLLVPGLEECLLDERHVSELLADNLIGSKYSKGANTMHKELKTSLRLAIFKCLCSHVVNTPLYSVKFRVLRMLNQIPKVGSTSRGKLLLPLLSDVAGQNQEEQERNCYREELDPAQFFDQVVGVVTATDREGILTIQANLDPASQPRSPGLRKAVYRRIQAIWPGMKPDLQASLAKLLLEQAVGGHTGWRISEEQGNQAMETLWALPLTTSILQSFVGELPTIPTSLQDRAPVSKRRQTSHGQPTAGSEGQEALSIVRQTTIVLELVERAKPERHPQLLKGLFQVFSNLQHSSSCSYSATNFLQILTMDIVLAIVEKVESVDRSAIRADVLVDCIRTTQSPQMLNTALLLVAGLATAAPELILHSIMPVFTFMGASVLHQDDEFSTFVVKQTMDSVIPRLVQSLHKRKEGAFLGVSDLILSFAAAFEHIPNQRRLDLFTSLTDKIGPGDYLFALLAVLLDKYPNNRKMISFATDLANRYDVGTRLQTIERYLQVILDTQKSKPTPYTRLLVLDVKHTVDGAVANLLPLASAILNDLGLVINVLQPLDKTGEDAMSIQTSCEQILERVFILSEECRNNKKLDALCMQVLNGTLGLLPLSKLVEILQSLLERKDDNIRRQVLQSFEKCLNDRNLDQKASQMACLAFLPQLISFIEGTSEVALRGTAITCVDRIAEKYGKRDPSAIVGAAQTICGDNCLGAAEPSLRVTSLLCLATTVEVTAENFLPIIPKAFPVAVDTLNGSIVNDAEDESLYNAVYLFMASLLIYVPWAVTGTDLDCLLTISFKSANVELGKKCDHTRTEVLQLVSKQVEPRECFAALRRTWSSAMTEGPLAAKEHLDILRLAIGRQPKSMIVKQTEALGILFLEVFDLRRIQLLPSTKGSYETEQIDEVEDAVTEAAIAMIYKLNDATFRPLFLRIREWTTSNTLKEDDKARLNRQTTWFTFLLKFFDTLKSIVTTYAELIIEDCVEILKSVSPESNASMELWRRVVHTLHKTFEHDQDDFYQTPAHFIPVSTALLTQLAHASQYPVLPELIPAIAELAFATNSPAHHKEMNAAILKHMRSDSAAVRLAALQCERALTDRLGEEWLALLPEMLPFISEALEDDDEAVEKEVRRWVVSIEEILGESLDPMLQ